MHEWVTMLSQNAAYFLEAVAMLIIVCGSVRALYLYITSCAFTRQCLREFTRTRLRLGHSLSLGLEFLIGADILKSAVSPTWEDLGRLAAIVAIRSAINFLLMWELKEAEQASQDGRTG